MGRDQTQKMKIPRLSRYMYSRCAFSSGGAYHEPCPVTTTIPQVARLVLRSSPCRGSPALPRSTPSNESCPMPYQSSIEVPPRAPRMPYSERTGEHDTVYSFASTIECRIL